jgi:predicted dehydrogenase
LVHEDKIIGDVARAWVDFGLEMNLGSLPANSRLKDPALGAGSLLDIGIYSLMWGCLLLNRSLAPDAPRPSIVGSSILQDGIDISTAMILNFDRGTAQGILTSSMLVKTPETFARIEGSKGTITVQGMAASSPGKFTIKLNGEDKDEVLTFEKPGYGFYYEADSVALDIAAGKLEDDTMPLAETLRILDLMDEVRRQTGMTYPQDL